VSNFRLNWCKQGNCFGGDEWQAAIQPFAGKVGKIKKRKFKSVDYSDPETETPIVEFESSFTKISSASEIIILK
jgi:hypothetical protein